MKSGRGWSGLGQSFTLCMCSCNLKYLCGSFEGLMVPNKSSLWTPVVHGARPWQGVGKWTSQAPNPASCGSGGGLKTQPLVSSSKAKGVSVVDQNLSPCVLGTAHLPCHFLLKRRPQESPGKVLLACLSTAELNPATVRAPLYLH